MSGETNLLARLEADFKEAMRGRQEDRLSALRMIKSALKVKEKEANTPVDEPGAVKVLRGLAKQRQDAAEQYKAAGRSDLAAKEEAELVLINSYLPARLDEAAVRAAAQEAIAASGASGPKDMGKVMKILMPKLGDAADGQTASRVVKELLGA